ncbi:MAG TPA: acyl carrier protein [Lachnospiraceae bacterium]|nr:acyl carrier protein [Lachnospiraceae bacterium]
MMEKIKFSERILEIKRIIEYNNLLEIEFNEHVDINVNELAEFDLLTSGDSVCRTFSGYTTVYKADNNTLILSNDGSVYTDTSPIENPTTYEPYVPTLSEVKLSKLAEISKICQNTIFEGTNIETSQGRKHYSLTIEDQTNISYAYSVIQNGAIKFPYHADGELCSMYTADDIRTLANEVTAFKLYHTTYCNHLNVLVRRSETLNEVRTITYGMSLPSDLEENFAIITGKSTRKEEEGV